jgi:FkbM family methyltransferase
MKPRTEVIDGWKSFSGDTALKAAMKQGNGCVAAYQKNQLIESIAFCKQRRTSIDIGAHIGIMTYNMSKEFRHVHSFEIFSETYALLEHNIETHSVKNCTLYNCGIGMKEESVAVNFRPRKSFSTHVAPGTEGNCKVRSLDSYGFTDVDFIKIDAEGYEPLIALGAMKTITRCLPVILFERKNHPTRYGYKRDSIIEILEPLGYRVLKEFGAKNAVIGVLGNDSV